MPGPFHSWMYLTSGGYDMEVINAARTSAYLQNSSLAPRGFEICNALDFGGCENYAQQLSTSATAPGWIHFPGISGNYLSAPDASGLDVVNFLQLTAHIAPADWTPSGTQAIVSKWVSPTQRSYRLALLTSGALHLNISSDGATAVGFTSSVTLASMPADEPLWVAVAYSGTPADKFARFWTSLNGTVWTELGVAQSLTGTAALFNSTSPLEIGTIDGGTAERFVGRISEVQVWAGIGTGGTLNGGDLRFELDGNDYFDADATTITAATGQTVTVHTSGGTPLTVEPGVECGLWTQLVFDTPSTDGAPWFNANYPESADALGFYVEEWTGLGNNHVKGTLASIGRPGGGGRVGALGSEGRVMKINLFAIARTEDAMQYLFDWLSTILIGVCTGCGDDTMLFRRFCGDVSDPYKGLGEMRNVRLVEGPTWEAEPTTVATCVLRRISFTLAAGDPCIYLPASDVEAGDDDFTADLSACFTAANVADDRFPCRPTCSELSANCRSAFGFDINPLGAMAPIVTMDNATSEPTIPMRVLLYADPTGAGIDPSPCGLLIVAEIYVRSLPANSTFVWDVAGRTVRFRDVTTGDFIDGSPYLDFNDSPIPRYTGLPCGQTWLVFEPGNLCLDEDGGEWTDPASGYVFTDPAFPTTTVQMQERVGCA